MMHRQVQILREVLVRIRDGVTEFDAAVEHDTWYHAWLLRDGGYVEAMIADTVEAPALWKCRLTWKGQDLLDQMGNPDLLDEAQQSAQAITGDANHLGIVLAYLRRAQELRSATEQSP